VIIGEEVTAKKNDMCYWQINAVLLNTKINQPKLDVDVNMCGYKLATNWQNFTEIYLTKVKLLQKVFWGRGGNFFIHTVKFC